MTERPKANFELVQDKDGAPFIESVDPGPMTWETEIQWVFILAQEDKGLSNTEMADILRLTEEEYELLVGEAVIPSQWEGLRDFSKYFGTGLDFTLSTGRGPQDFLGMWFAYLIAERIRGCHTTGYFPGSSSLKQWSG